MIFWKIDTATQSVRAVTGEGWPGMDSDGVPIFDDTHFATEGHALLDLAAWQESQRPR